jgi:hypothetical protein
MNGGLEMSKVVNGALIVIFILALLLVGCTQLVNWALSPDEYTITTEQGDKFDVWLDTFLMKGSLKAQNSDLDIYIGYRVKKEDFKCLKHTKKLTVYNFYGTILFDDGDGFDELNIDNIDEEDEVVQLVKDNLMSSISMISENLPLLLASSKYSTEATKITVLAREEKYSELEKYGLDYELVKDDSYKRRFKEIIEVSVQDSKKLKKTNKS